MRISIWLVLVSVFLLATGSLRADPPAKPPGQPGPKRAAFDKLFAEWKQLLIELASLREEHVWANPERRKEIEKLYDQLLAKGEVLQPKLAKAAEEAYTEAPGADLQIVEFLLKSCRGYFRMDDYEEALRLARLLIKHGCQEKNLYLWGGVAAFCAGQLDSAEKYLTTAKKKGLSLRTGKSETLDAVVIGFMHDPRDYKKAWKKEQAIRAAEAKADDLPRVLLKTNRGDIEVELFENEAPNTTANFISLVEKGFYDGLPFHRVLGGFMAQGGCPKGDGTGDPGYYIPCECYGPDHRKHFRGSLSMAKGIQRDTGGSQFFLTFIPTSHLDGQHTVFGRVVKGMNVLSKIRKRDPDNPKATLAAPDEIIEAKVLRRRPHKYVPKKAGE